MWREGRNVKTGKVERTVAVARLISSLHPFRCYRSKAADRFLMLYVAQADSHRVHCLNPSYGETLWTFTAGARIDSPPTIHNGMALFGCRDGWVYSLNAADGGLCWRFADDNNSEPVLAENRIGREKGSGFTRSEPPKWSKQIPLRVEAMVLAGDKLFMVGPPDVVPEDDPYAAFDGKMGAQLWVVSAFDGDKITEYPLESLPVLDGLIAAAGRLYLANREGEIQCFAGL